MRARRIGAAAAAAALAVGVAACGGGDSTSGDASAKTEEGAKAAFTEIVSSKDPATCDRLTDDYLETLFPTETTEKARATCEDVITQGNDPGEIDVRTITVEGDEASGDATSALGYQRFRLVYVDGEWQLDSLEAGPGKSGGNGSGNGG